MLSVLPLCLTEWLQPDQTIVHLYLFVQSTISTNTGLTLNKTYYQLGPVTLRLLFLASTNVSDLYLVSLKLIALLKM